MTTTAANSLWLEEYLPFFDRYQTAELTAEDWSQWRRGRLRTTLRHVRDRSPFYGRHLAGIDVDSITPDTLDRLPFTTKDDLRREMFDALSGGPAQALMYYETTGTTGASTPCPRDAKDVKTSNIHVEWAWRRMFEHYFGARRPVVGLMGPSELYAFGDTFGDVAQRLDACHVKIWPESPRVGFRKALRLLRELEVEVVVAAPALCLNLAKAALQNGLDPARDFSVKLFCTLGEICTPAFGENVRSIWGADVRPALYGSQEALSIGTGCTHDRLHISQPNYLVEVLDPDTSASLGGYGTGELCLTMLIDGIKPLIRYRTGDLVIVSPNACGCGGPGDVVEVLGRVADRVRIGANGYRPAQIESSVLGGLTGCLGYQVVIDADADGGDRLTVHLDLRTPDGEEAARLGAETAARLSEHFGVPARVDVTTELDPITNTGAFVSWKAARIRDNRVTGDADAEAARAVATAHRVTT
ncbi:phenylacetate--CoA ligase family protein [Actinoplanes sp. NPDC049668]|uniref:phenylacetate--CoA ligase family protein n=1 Tax=unclassified Actinoplanes TaxID=2626549 RepID=UPI0033BBB5A1